MAWYNICLPKTLDAVDSLCEVIGSFRGHLKVESELAVAKEEVWLWGSPGSKLNLGLLDQNVQSVGVLLYHAKQVDKLPADLVWCLIS